jgi:hypothetical protein
MSWQIARMGSRFSLFFEPHHRRVMHSALGRLLDRPLDLMVGMVEPDGTERALPFSRDGEPFYHAEQFERSNSITFRGYSPAYTLSYEFNVHSVFYPQDERLCLMPAIYLEIRINPAADIHRIETVRDRPSKVQLFLRIARPDTQVSASAPDGVAQIDLNYANALTIHRHDGQTDPPQPPPDAPSVSVAERIVSLNREAQPDPDGCGLTLELPVSEVGSGIKWRLVWGAYCADDVMAVASGDPNEHGRFRYTRYWSDLDAVMEDAVTNRDDRLARSRLFERAIEQAPLRMAQRHLVHQSFQSFLANTFWIDPDDAATEDGDDGWYDTWSANGQACSSIDEARFGVMFYLAVWPALLAQQLGHWARRQCAHEESDGSYLAHTQAAPLDENASFLILLATYMRWTGDLTAARRHDGLIQRLANYLKWTDDGQNGFPNRGLRPSEQDTVPWPATTLTLTNRTYSAVTRLAGLAAASDLLMHLGHTDQAESLDALVGQARDQIETNGWAGDHYGRGPTGAVQSVGDGWEDPDFAYQQSQHDHAYGINTSNALLMPILVGQSPMLDSERLVTDILGSQRETLGPYGCAEWSNHPERISLSQNLWRDQLARYLGMSAPSFSQCYWDLQVLSNTGGQSMGFTETHIHDHRPFSPAGIVSFGCLLCYPRLVIDRLAPGGARISVDPMRHFPQRWPLLPLADWQARKVPVCVVNAHGRVSIENDNDPVFVRGNHGVVG